MAPWPARRAATAESTTLLRLVRSRVVPMAWGPTVSTMIVDGSRGACLRRLAVETILKRNDPCPQWLNAGGRCLLAAIGDLLHLCKDGRAA